jgi:hypothetical protein
MTVRLFPFVNSSVTLSAYNGWTCAIINLEIKLECRVAGVEHKPCSSYSDLSIHISQWEDGEDANTDPPIHARCLLDASAITLTSVFGGASAIISFL